jgi:hypothetical protein
MPSAKILDSPKRLTKEELDKLVPESRESYKLLHNEDINFKLL